MASDILGDDEESLAVRERRAVDPARGPVVDRGGEELFHAERQRLRRHAERGVEPGEEPVVDAERDAAAAPRGQDALGRQRHRASEGHLRAAVHGGHVEPGDLGEILDHLLHPEVADDERLELDRRAEEREELRAIHVDRQRLFAYDLAGDLVGAIALDSEIGSHRDAPARF